MRARSLATTALLGAALLISACARDPHEGHAHAAGGPASDGVDAGTATAAAAAAPGACAPHGVLAEICPKCNPSLAPIFQAKGDWCAEHGFPESFCPICHPEMGGRPAGVESLSGNEPPADGLVIRLKGPEAEARAAFATARAESAPAEDTIVAVARIEAGPRHRADVSARTEAIVAKLLVDIGDHVRAGQSLATLSGPDGEVAQGRVAAAEARVEAARAGAVRERQLEARGISPARDRLAAEQALAEAEAELRAAQAGLQIVGGREQRLSSPLEGIVTRRVASIGQLVRPGDVLFEVADLSGVDAVADVREEFLASIAPGRMAEVVVAAISPERLEAVVESVAPTVDPLTRTGQVRLHVDNPEGLLRPGMAAEARLRSTRRQDTVLIPREAVQQARGAHLAFVRTGVGVFETRRVVLGAPREERVEIVHGLAPGEEVVTTGSFLLKTETLPGAIGSGCCEIEGVTK